MKASSKWMMMATAPGVVTLALGLALTGCSSSVAATAAANAISPGAAATVTPTLITDAPADQVLALSLTVDSIVLTDSAGKTATVLSTPVPIEVSHLDAVQEPLLPPLSIPQDTYVSATITVASPTVVYVDTTTKTVIKAAATLASSTDVVTFATPITVSSTSKPICFDLLVGQSVAISGTTVTVTPTFNVTQIPLTANPTNPGNGKVNDVVGQVISASGTSLVLTQPNGQQVTITTDNNTVFQGFTALSALTAGELVDVDVAQQSSGTLLAVRIHLIPAPAGALFVGPVTAVTGSPATSFTELVRQPLGTGTTASATGTSYTIGVTGSTVFQLAAGAGTLPTLPFTPTFTAATLFAGQNVLVAASSVSGTTAMAASVTLAPQTVGGTVASQTTVGGLIAYTVTLTSGSALGTLTGATSVVVYVSPSTQTTTATAVTVGNTVRFNGLLFNNAGTLSLVAGLSCDGPAAAPPQKHQ